MADPDAEEEKNQIPKPFYTMSNELPVTVAAGVVGNTLFLPLAVDTTSCCDDPGVWCGCVDAIYH